MGKRLLFILLTLMLLLWGLTLTATAATATTVTLSVPVAAAGESVTASGVSEGDTWIAVKVLDSAGDIVTLDFVKSGADGSYSCTFIVPAVADGTLRVIAGYDTNVAKASLAVGEHHTVTVSANPPAGGTVTGGGEYLKDSSVTVTAAANSGYTFVNWTEAGSPVSTDATYTFTLDTIDRPLTAHFTAAVGSGRTVTVTSQGNGTASGGGVKDVGQSVTLGAAPAAGYNFEGWYAGTTKVSSLPNYTFTPDADVTLTARFITMPQSTLEITIAGSGGVTMNGTAFSSGDSASRPRGTSITLTATADSGNSFAYWQDTRSGSLLSIALTYTFLMGADISLTAVFHNAPNDTTGFTVTFQDKNGKILQSDTVAKNAAVTPPAAPSLPGYSFTGWDKTSDSVISDMTITALYQRLPATYTLTVVGGALSTGKNSGSFQYDMPVTVVAGTAPSGQKFSCWQQDGVKVSTSSSYSFYTLMQDTTLTAVFTAADTVLADTPFIFLSIDVQVDTIGKKIQFIASRSVPDGYTLIESGVLLLQTNTAFTGELTVDTAGVILGRIKNDSTDQFYISKSNLSTGETWYGRAYLMYRDVNGNIVTVYSNNTEHETIN